MRRRNWLVKHRTLRNNPAMIETSNPQINVQALMEKVRAEVQRRKEPASAGAPAAIAGGVPVTDLMARLRQGILETVTALNQARQKNKADPRIPNLAHGLFRNQGAVNGNLLRATDLLWQQTETLSAIASALDQKLEQNTTNLRAELRTELQAANANLRAELRTELQAANANLRAELRTELQAANANLRAELRTELQAANANLRAELVLQRQLMARLLGKFNTYQEPSTNQPMAEISMIRQHGLDAFYFAFENHFRGTRTEIKERARVYLPCLSEAGVGMTEKPVLDVGCGRGEWLELLKENNCSARGADANTTMVALCRELGLDVTLADAVTHLRSLPARSQGAVTGFHIIEHLPFPILLELMAESWRVLQPSGVAIFETPNPGNVQVGTNNFYIDPSHLHPLPALLSQFLLETVGFTNVRILYLQPCDISSHEEGADSFMAQRFNEFFYGAQDYAVIGTKPATAAE